MRFPNAFDGVKKIYVAAILSIIASVVIIIGAFAGIAGVGLAAAASAGDGEGAGAAALASLGGFALFTLASGVMAIIAFILQIVGVNKASKEEASFKKALYVIIGGIVASLLASAFSGVSVMNAIFTFASEVCQFLVIYFILSGIIALSSALGAADMEETGKKTQKFYSIVYAASIVLSLVSSFTSGTGIVYSIFSILASIASIVAMVLYLVYLSKAKKMLSAAQTF